MSDGTGALSRRFFAFAAVGAVATLLHYAVLVAGVEWLALDPPLASALGFCLSLGCNYWLNHRYTFAGRAAHNQALGRFLVVAAIGLALNTACMMVLAGWPALHYLLAQLAATLLTLVWNFSASHWWAFRASEDPDAH